MKNKRLVAILTVLALFGASCASDETSAPDDDDSTATTSTTTTPPSTSTAPPSTEAPSNGLASAEPATVAGFRDQVIGWMNGEPEPGQSEFEAIFSSSFRAAVTLDVLNSLWADLIPLGPWQSVETLGEDITGGAFVLEGSDPEPRLVLTFTIEDAQVVEALLQPWTEPPASFDEAVAAVDGLGRSSYVIAETTSGECARVVGVGADDVMALGSVFKLIVLGAVVEAVADGTVAWDDPVEIRDELDSFPSGTTQDVPAGTTMTVRELAELMISISDNTATDHLIDLVTREQVEAAQSTYGITQPELNQPFLTTRELFQIKLDAGLRARYLDADETTRRAILAEISTVPLAPIEEALAGWTGPIELDTLEWFATPTDICRVLIGLDADPEAAAILQINPGVPDESGRWTSIGFKGGSEPGLLVTAWTVTDSDDRTFTVIGGAVSDGLIDDSAAVLAFAGLRDNFEAP